jgi:hypothetical protein
MSFHVFIQTTFIINFKSRSARDRMVVTFGKSVVFCRYSFFFHLYNWPTQYCRNVVDGGVKHHNPKSRILENDLAYTYIRFFLTLALNETMSRLMTFTRYALYIRIFTTTIMQLHINKYWYLFYFLSGPKQHTVKDFWQMIWQERVDKIVMVTQLVEGKVVTLYYS